MSATDQVDVNGDQTLTLYRHTKRTQWGMAIIAWERGDKRAYQFEDGKMRIFKKSFFRFFERVEPPLGESSALVSELERRINLSKRQSQGQLASEQKVYIKFSTQLEIFRQQYPGGFQDPAWMRDVRGEGAQRALKRHRDPILVKAQTVLSKDAFDEALSQGNEDAIWKQAAELLQSTTLITPSHLKPVEKLRADDIRNIVAALAEVLYGDDIFELRFERWISALSPDLDGPQPTWQLVTTLLALVQPEQHVCVRPSSFRKQATSLAPHIRYQKIPTAKLYVRYQKMANDLKAKLAENELNAKDMIDIHDFIWNTMRPASKKLTD